MVLVCFEIPSGGENLSDIHCTNVWVELRTVFFGYEMAFSRTLSDFKIVKALMFNLNFGG